MTLFSPLTLHFSLLSRTHLSSQQRGCSESGAARGLCMGTVKWMRPGGCRPEEETDMHIDNADTGYRVPRSLRAEEKGQGSPVGEQMVLSQKVRRGFFGLPLSRKQSEKCSRKWEQHQVQKCKKASRVREPQAVL